jgi:hypothetical protein
MSQARKIAGVRRSNKYMALVEQLGLTDAAALAVLGHTVEPKADPRLAELIEAGFTPEEAAELLEDTDTTPDTEPEPEPEPEPELTSKDRADALVAEHDLTFTRGRVYLSRDAIEAQVRVFKTGTPEIVATSGVGRAKAVVFYLSESGDLAAQHLTDAV